MAAIEDLHPSARKVAEALVSRGAQGPFLEYGASTKPAADAARALECDVGAIASCLVFVLDGEAVVIIKSGASRVDTALFAELAKGVEVRAATGQPIGGVSPINWPETLRVFIDDSLARYERIFSACGTPNAVFATTFDELALLTSARIIAL